MTLIETEQMCEIHFLDPVPLQSCSLCKKRVRASNPLEPERIIIPSSLRPEKSIYMWYPYTVPVWQIPKDRDFVHINGAFNADQFDLLCEHLPNLVIVEIVPSVAHLVESNINWYSRFHVGITARRRYRQS